LPLFQSEERIRTVHPMSASASVFFGGRAMQHQKMKKPALGGQAMRGLRTVETG
jgi:hypothetical protein